MTIALEMGSPLPDVLIDEESIYEKLPSGRWTLIVCGKEKIKFQVKGMKIMHVPKDTYPSRYIFIKPDHTIQFAGDTVNEKLLSKI